MNWSYDMGAAPKGDTRKVQLTHHKTGGTYSKEITVKQPVLISTATYVLVTTWSQDRKQWVGLADGEKAIAWQAMPDPARPEGLGE